MSSRVVDDDLLNLLAANYTLNGVGGATVAGRRATEISAWSLGQRAARWWLDDETGIVLWQELYDRTGAVALSTGFTSVTVSPAAETDGAPPAAAGARDRHDLALGRRRGRLSSSGWSCERDLAGLSLVRLHTDRATGPTAVQAVYSDGVATVGVIEQRGRLDGPPPGTRWDPELRAYVRHGASQSATWQAGDTVLTVVTDGPADVLTRAVASLPPERSSTPTTMDRSSGGLGLDSGQSEGLGRWETRTRWTGRRSTSRPGQILRTLRRAVRRPGSAAVGRVPLARPDPPGPRGRLAAAARPDPRCAYGLARGGSAERGTAACGPAR